MNQYLHEQAQLYIQRIKMAEDTNPVVENVTPRLLRWIDRWRESFSKPQAKVTTAELKKSYSAE